MILLDKPLVSDFVLDSIKQGLFSALDTGNVVPQGGLKLLREDEALNRLKRDPVGRIHTISENSIAWIEENLSNDPLTEKIRLFKDKFAFREMTTDLFPGLFYKKVKAGQINELDTSEMNFPLIIKPNIGFFSMGVHSVTDKESWAEACNKISAGLDHIQTVYPRAVVDTTEFIIEGVITGEEYAFDAYFDENGEPVLVGVMHHLFGGETDVSDRVYLTSAEIVTRHKNVFIGFLNEIGKRAELRNFSLHVEVRINDDGELVPIEINPLRFGAWCTSADLMHHAFGINPYHYYLNNIRPDWEEIISNMNDDIFSIIILDNSTGIPGPEIREFNYTDVMNRLGHVLELRKIDYHKYPIFGILFSRFQREDFHQIEEILHDDLKKYTIF